MPLVRRRNIYATLLIVLAIAIVCALSYAQRRGNAFSPRRVEASDANIRQLKPPPGFQISVFAREVDDARMIAVMDDGTVLVTRPGAGDVIALRDRDGDGRAEERKTVASDVGDAHGILLHQGKLYLAPTDRVLVADIRPGGAVGPFRKLLDLPVTSSHQNRTLGVGPDGKLYITVGSSCNVCVEEDEKVATMLQANLDGSGLRVFAKGLRNTIGFAWHPETKVLYGMDHGADWRGDDMPGEELNHIQDGKHYGWPYCLNDRIPDPSFEDPPGSTKDKFCKTVESPVLTHTAHSSPIGFAFYTGAMFPAEYRNDAFVAFRGSWNRVPPSGYKVARIRFENGKPVKFEDFVTGFLLPDGQRHFARIAGLAVARDGALLISDDSNGVIYRVTYAK